MNEFELIERVSHGFPVKADRLIQGVGDDAAVIRSDAGRDWLVTTDALFEGVHFKTEWTTFQDLGKKALSVNVSDIAAMGGKPLYYFVTIGIPKNFPERDIDAVFAGMSSVASNHRMILSGGDTCKSAGGLLLSLTVVGDVESGKSIFRSGAKAGDSVYVTGTLGGSSLGLSCLEKGTRGLDVREFIKLHNNPIPRVAAGGWLSASGCVSSMIDVSDGLAQDLGHISRASEVGIKIDSSLLPLPENFKEGTNACYKDSYALALTGGEDYELAFTISNEKLQLFEKMLKVVQPTFGHPVTKIGEVIEGEGVVAVDVHGIDIPLSRVGFEHKF